jgi:plastocyanin domain-containing protein
MVLILSGRDKTPVQQENIKNVSVVDGKQIIEIKAKGGYTPRVSTAKAGIPTVLRFNTDGTFDCSALVRIPSINVSEILPNSGIKDIDLGSPKGGILQGSCGMGMYPFKIDFQNL